MHTNNSPVLLFQGIDSVSTTWTHIVENLVSLSSLDHVELVGVLYGVVAELSLDGGEVDAGLLRFKTTATRHVSIAIDGTGEREGERERERERERESTSILYFRSNYF